MMMGLYQIGSSAVIALIAVYLLTGSRWRTLYILYRTLPRDIIAAIRFAKAILVLWYWERRDYTVATLFTRRVEEHPDKVAIIYEDEEWTYRELDKFTNRFARYIRTQPFSRKDDIALLMGNRPEYVGIWLALSKAGFITALINTNLRKDVLIHTIKIAGSKAIIFGAEYKDAIEEVRHKIPDVALYQWTEDTNVPYQVLSGAIELNSPVAATSDDPIIVDMGYSNPRDKLIYIYTSGTTGMPKAAVVSNLRYMMMACGVYYMLALRQSDRIYNSLPLYHTAGGIIGVGQAICNGITIVVRKKFSASNFWSESIRYDCTIAQYIGEICRFLLLSPPSPNDTQHKIRLMFGNGIRPQIWEQFIKRFKVKQIGEFYGATEGNSNLVNIDGKVGAVGFLPIFMGPIYPIVLIKVDEETGELLRGPDGLCIRCKHGEPGILVGKINPKKPVHDFSGYADTKETEKKIIYDVFKKGDRAFNTGDILVMDELGYFYFKDRRGDTFRWKGENVATTEVEAVISNVINLKDSVVYGVEVAGNEGKAGMAAIYDPENTLNLKDLADGLKKCLPAYARPIFVRVLSELPLTGTFKLQKRDLQREGYDIAKIKDHVYMLDKSGNYVRFTEHLYQDLLAEKLRL